MLPFSARKRPVKQLRQSVPIIPQAQPMQIPPQQQQQGKNS